VYRLIPVFDPFAMALLLVGIYLTSHPLSALTSVPGIQNHRPLRHTLRNLRCIERRPQPTSILTVPGRVNPDGRHDSDILFQRNGHWSVLCGSFHALLYGAEVFVFQVRGSKLDRRLVSFV